MEKIKWFDRKFDFGNTQHFFPSIMERLSGTAARLEEKLKGLPKEILSVRHNNTWSIKENIGHLIDLEPLWQGRFEDIKNGAGELRPTDLQNTKTDEAGHNDKSIDDLLADFRAIRQKTLQQLDGIDDATIFKSALHPRLKTPMRTIDQFYFVAEHDDHHLARITELSRLLT